MSSRCPPTLYSIWWYCIVVSSLWINDDTTAFIPSPRLATQPPPQRHYIPTAQKRLDVFSFQQERKSFAQRLGSSSKEVEEEEEEEELTVERIAELIEVSFVNACMQLATGYVDVLKLFITSVKASYERSIPIYPTLSSSLDSCPVQSANRPLMKEEQDLRLLWVQLVYLTLQQIGVTTLEGKVFDEAMVGCEEVREKYTEVVRAVIQKTKQVDTLNDDDDDKDQQKVPLGSAPLVTLEDLPSDVIMIKEDNGDDPMVKALLAQNVRVIGVTLAVLEEEERCFGDGMGGSGKGGGGESPPKPPIPGAF